MSYNTRTVLTYILGALIYAISFLLCFLVLGFTGMTVVSVLTTGILITISLIDLNTTTIPNWLVIALIPLSLSTIWLQPDIYLWSRILGFFAISLPMLLATLALSGAFGGGDIKLMAVCGFLLGWQNILVAFFIASIIGGGFAMYLMVTGKKKRGEHMVFGPALAVGVFVALLFGAEVLGWYLYGVM